MMTAKKCIPAMLLPVILSGFCAWGDVLTLQSAESFSGALQRIRTGALAFRTSLKGQMMVPVDTVASLSTEGNFVITLGDDRVFYGSFVTREGDTFIRSLDGSAEQSVDIGAVSEALPIPKTQETGLSAEQSKAAWLSTIETGVQHHAGDNDNTEPFAKIEVSRSNTGGSFEGSLAIEGSNPDSFPAWLRGIARYQQSSGNRVAPFIEAAVERDTNAALELRTDLVLGLGGVFYSNIAVTEGESALEGGFGLNLAHESWDVTSMRQGVTGIFGEGGATTDSLELSLRLDLRFSRALFRHGLFTSEVILYPSLSELGSLRARAESAFTLPLTDRLKLRMNVLTGYDSDPAFRNLDRWTGMVGASVRVDF